MRTPIPRETAVAAPPMKARLHYLDWLRLILTLGVFLVHTSDVFNDVQFEIKNAEQNTAITMVQGFFFPWGMPLFFFVAGAGSYFALRKRTAGEFTRERTLRILVPFLTGTFLLGPLQILLSWRHRVSTGVIDWTLGEFVAERFARVGPKWFGAIGYHMWFLGYLFAFALIALPLFVWFKGPAGRRFVAGLAGLCARRGGILLFILPVVLTRLVLQPFFPVQHDWADFINYAVFYALGYLVFLDGRFLAAIRRDWAILLAVGLLATLGYGMLVVSLPDFNFEGPPITFPDYLLWALFSVAGWCGTAFMMFIGMRFLDRTGRVQRYCLEIMLPFFVIHQPVILAIAYFVVQWNMGLWPKFLVVMVGAFALSLGACEFVVKRVGLLRVLFGLKATSAEAVRPALAA